VLLAKKFNVVRWLRDGYTRLLNETPLLISNLSMLDWETKCKIYYAKCGGSQTHINSNHGSYYYCTQGSHHYTGSVCVCEGSTLFDEVFGDEFKAMEAIDVTTVG